MKIDALDLSTLSNHLWESADNLRGRVDAADFRTYILVQARGVWQTSSWYQSQSKEALGASLREAGHGK